MLENVMHNYGRNERRLTMLLLALHVLITIPLAAVSALGVDEGRSLVISSDSLAETIHRAVVVEHRPPFYFAVLQVWRGVFGDSIFAARMLSVLCAAGAVLALGAVSRRYLPRIHTPRLVAVAALSPFVIWYAVEIHLYALMLLVSALQFITLYDGFLAGEDRVNRDEEIRRCRSRVWYMVLAVIGLYTHFYSGFFLVAAAGSLLGVRRWYSLKVYAIAMVFVGVCFLPMLTVMSGQLLEKFAVEPESVSLLESARHIGTWLQQFLLAPAGESQQHWSLLAWRGIQLFLSGALIWKFRRFFSWGQNEFLFWRDNVVALSLLAGVFCFFVGVTALAGPAHVDVRHTAMLFLPVMIASFAIAGTVGGNRAVGWWSCLIVCFGSASLLMDYQTVATPGDTVLVFPHQETHEETTERI